MVTQYGYGDKITQGDSSHISQSPYYDSTKADAFEKEVDRIMDKVTATGDEYDEILEEVKEKVMKELDNAD